ncbi:unnamed protein product [Boreogadus saida]
MGPASQYLSYLPYHGGPGLGEDNPSKLVNFHFLLSCFRRDSHNIDSFLKVLRCRSQDPEPIWQPNVYGTHTGRPSPDPSPARAKSRPESC